MNLVFEYIFLLLFVDKQRRTTERKWNNKRRGSIVQRTIIQIDAR